MFNWLFLSQIKNYVAPVCYWTFVDITNHCLFVFCRLPSLFVCEISLRQTECFMALHMHTYKVYMNEQISNCVFICGFTIYRMAHKIKAIQNVSCHIIYQCLFPVWGQCKFAGFVASLDAIMSTRGEEAFYPYLPCCRGRWAQAAGPSEVFSVLWSLSASSGSLDYCSPLTGCCNRQASPSGSHRCLQ